MTLSRQAKSRHLRSCSTQATAACRRWFLHLPNARTGTIDARNAKIFNILSLVKIGERSGMGLSQLYGNWEEAGYARPQLSESFSPERTKVEIEVEVAEKRGEVTEKDTEKRGEVTERPTETDERIIALIQSNPHITQKMLSEAIGLTRPYVGRKLLGLQARNIIRRIGPDNGGYWEVVKGDGKRTR